MGLRLGWGLVLGLGFLAPGFGLAWAGLGLGAWVRAWSRLWLCCCSKGRREWGGGAWRHGAPRLWRSSVVCAFVTSVRTLSPSSCGSVALPGCMSGNHAFCARDKSVTAEDA